MAHTEDSMDKRRGEIGFQALEETKNLVTGGRSPMLVVRAALAFVFMLLIWFSYMIMGEEGLIAVSVLVIAGLLGPAWMWVIRRYRKQQRDSQNLEQFQQSQKLRETDT